MHQPTPPPTVADAGHPTTGSKFGCLVPGYPPMRMPRDTGAILIQSCEFDPAGALAAFTGTWHAHLAPTDTGDDAVVLQLHAPATGEPDHVDVRIWFARHHRWHPVGRWDAAGPDWPWLAAPIIAAAATGLPARLPKPHTGSQCASTACTPA